jgi:hypothetical protein
VSQHALEKSPAHDISTIVNAQVFMMEPERPVTGAAESRA